MLMAISAPNIIMIMVPMAVRSLLLSSQCVSKATANPTMTKYQLMESITISFEAITHHCAE